MRWRPLTWLLLSVTLFAAALYFWRLGDRRADKGNAEGTIQNAESDTPHSALRTPHSSSRSTPLPLLSQAGNLNSLPVAEALTNHASRITNHFALRLRNNPIEEIAFDGPVYARRRKGFAR